MVSPCCGFDEYHLATTSEKQSAYVALFQASHTQSPKEIPPMGTFVEEESMDPQSLDQYYVAEARVTTSRLLYSLRKESGPGIVVEMLFNYVCNDCYLFTIASWDLVVEVIGGDGAYIFA